MLAPFLSLTRETYASVSHQSNVERPNLVIVVCR